MWGHGPGNVYALISLLTRHGIDRNTMHIVNDKQPFSSPKTPTPHPITTLSLKSQVNPSTHLLHFPHSPLPLSRHELHQEAGSPLRHERPRSSLKANSLSHDKGLRPLISSVRRTVQHGAGKGSRCSRGSCLKLRRLSPGTQIPHRPRNPIPSSWHL